MEYRKDYGKLIQGRIWISMLRSLITESIPLAVTASCAVLYSRCDSIMIGKLLSKADVGIYAIAVKLISVAQMGITPVRESVYPGLVQLYRTDHEQYKRRYIQITTVLTWMQISA